MSSYSFRICINKHGRIPSEGDDRNPETLNCRELECEHHRIDEDDEEVYTKPGAQVKPGMHFSGCAGVPSRAHWEGMPPPPPPPFLSFLSFLLSLFPLFSLCSLFSSLFSHLSLFALVSLFALFLSCSLSLVLSFCLSLSVSLSLSLSLSFSLCPALSIGLRLLELRASPYTLNP